MSRLVSYQFRYSFRSSYMVGAMGCQMPASGTTTGSAIWTLASLLASGT